MKSQNTTIPGTYIRTQVMIEHQARRSFTCPAWLAAATDESLTEQMARLRRILKREFPQAKEIVIVRD